MWKQLHTYGFAEFRGFMGGNVDYHTHIAGYGVKQLDWWHNRENKNEEALYNRVGHVDVTALTRWPPISTSPATGTPAPSKTTANAAALREDSTNNAWKGDILIAEHLFIHHPST